MKLGLVAGLALAFASGSHWSPPPGVRVVSRDWLELAASLVLTRLGDDPNWGGEYLIDISTKAKRLRAARWAEPMIRRCAQRDFDALELDNLDSWTRFDGTPLAKRVPFGREDAIAYARLLVALAHRYGLAAAQKDFLKTCRRFGSRLLVVLRDVDVTAPGSKTYRYRAC